MYVEHMYCMWNIGNVSVKGKEVYEELRKRLIDVCCMQKVRWRGQSSRV